MNTKGASTGLIVLLILGALLAYSANFLSIKDTVDNLFSKGVSPTPTPSSKCPSSGLTAATINTKKALAATATISVHDYYVYDGNTLIANGNSGADGISTFDVACALGKKYQIVVVNETTNTGFYTIKDEIDASGPTDTINLQTYEYGEIKLQGVINGVESIGGTTATNISVGAGKVCDFNVLFGVNKTASAFNKPLMLVQANTSSVTDVDMTGVTEAPAKKPGRLSAAVNTQFFTFELDKMLLSTDTLQTIPGKITFSTSTAPVDLDTSFQVTIIDQATFKKANYQTLSLTDGWVEAGENTETITNIGALDTATSTLTFSTSTGYC